MVFLPIKEPWFNPDAFADFVDRVVELDCENDASQEYKRMFNVYEQDMKRRREIHISPHTPKQSICFHVREVH